MAINGDGERKILPASVLRMIQSVKEVVKEHSDADIYVALQETDMNPNEATEKLLNQDPFHEVRRKRDKKKDSQVSQNSGYRGSVNHGVSRGGINLVAGENREFRVARDNKIVKNVSGEVKTPSPESSTSTSKQRVSGKSYVLPSRSYRQAAGHKKASHPAKEWKRKSSPKSNANSDGLIGSQTKPVFRPSDSSEELKIVAAPMQDKPTLADYHQNENVIFAESIRVSDSDRSHLTFGSFGTEVSSKTIVFGSLTFRVTEYPTKDVSLSLPISIESPTFGTSTSNFVDLVVGQIQISGSNPASGRSFEILLPDKDSPSSQNLDNYGEIGLTTHGSNTTCTHTESQQQQDPAEFASLQAYDAQANHDFFYNGASLDDSHSVQSSQKTLGSHMTHDIPVSSMSTVQQQQQLMQQMYQQLHVSPFTNMPYRPIISPVYGPPIQMTGNAGNHTYPAHPSKGNSILMMPDDDSAHLGANSVEYGIQQFEPVHGDGPSSGFRNFAASTTDYAIDAPGCDDVGVAAGLEQPSRLSYEGSSSYSQGETSEMPDSQSGASYYNMAGLMPHGSYMPPHSGHTSFDVAVAQSSHIQFRGPYHPPLPQAPGLENPHHLGGTSMGSDGANVAAPGAQMRAYQHPPMSHLNRNRNF